MTLPESVSLHYFELISSTHASVSSSTFLRSSRPLTNCTIVMTRKMTFRSGNALRLCCSDSNHSAPLTSTTTIATGGPAPPVLKRRKRYRREYPGESKGITEELRFVAMRLHNVNGKKLSGDAVDSSSEDEVGEEDDGNLALSDDENDENGDGTQTWQPSLEGFLKYLVDSKLVFSTVERIVDESGDVAYSYFRKSGLERSECLAKDLEWFREQGIVIPEPTIPGVSYAKYLEELAERSAPLFLCHYYNIYFSHIAGGQVIAKRVSERLLEGRKLEFYTWAGDAEELLKNVREKLNMLGEHWSRDDRNKCLREATKTFRFLGQIVRLIIS
ncbi:hypothetical protein IC582_015538 [Cucumis melo]|uniref:Probable inactive heme oxygenase 2, chloroplastic n=1 Tax=Cucumis melo TaxID=3656 RepID=A0A1S3BTF2_CUCME|nr:probable inactive heme oxygenase 2, chloroplastic [Cucumis melo]